MGIHHTREELEWHLPLVILNDHIHAANLRQGVATEWPETAKITQTNATATAQALRKKFGIQ